LQTLRAHCSKYNTRQLFGKLTKNNQKKDCRTNLITIQLSNTNQKKVENRTLLVRENIPHRGISVVTQISPCPQNQGQIEHESVVLRIEHI
jgi:hypothetical protein